MLDLDAGLDFDDREAMRVDAEVNVDGDAESGRKVDVEGIRRTWVERRGVSKGTLAIMRMSVSSML